MLARVSTWTRRQGGDLVLRSVSPALAEQLELAAGPRPTGTILQHPTNHPPRPNDPMD